MDALDAKMDMLLSMIYGVRNDVPIGHMESYAVSQHINDLDEKLGDKIDTVAEILVEVKDFMEGLYIDKLDTADAEAGEGREADSV